MIQVLRDWWMSKESYGKGSRSKGLGSVHHTSQSSSIGNLDDLAFLDGISP